MNIEELKELTNDKGRQLIDRWLDNKKIIYTYLPQGDETWFYVLFNNNSAVSLPFTKKDGSGSFFGDRKYLENYLKKSYAVNHPELLFQLMELKI